MGRSMDPILTLGRRVHVVLRLRKRASRGDDHRVWFCSVSPSDWCNAKWCASEYRALLAKLDAPGARYRAQRDKIDEFVSFHELPGQLTSKLHAYCEFLFAVNRGFDIGVSPGALPPNLRASASYIYMRH